MRLIGKYVGVIFLLSLFWNCTTFDSPQPLLIGHWRWESSVGGIAGATMKPKPNEQIILQFGAKRHFSIVRNDTLLLSGLYRIGKGAKTSNIDFEQVTINNTVRQSGPVMGGLAMMSGPITALSTNRLSFGDGGCTGFNSSYVRVK